MKASQKSQFAEFEEELIKIWEKEKTFEQSLANRKGQPRFTFYDGPPYANGLPHHGHVVPSTLKDAITRYKTMQGYYVLRRLGWDTHGLPVEYQIEKELRFRGRKDILDYGIDKFNAACRASVFRYKAEWEGFIKRLGRWADFKNAYATMDDDYIESVWWVFSEIYKLGLIFKGQRSTPYCPRCATPLSNFELNQGYKDDIQDPSLYVKFRLPGSNTSLLAWTTTPWTLPGNAALAVDAKANYVSIEFKDDSGKTQKLILAEDRLKVIDYKYQIVDRFKGAKLVGKDYQPLFELKLDVFSDNESQANLYKIWAANFVNLEDGTGVVHVAPAFGEDDLKLGVAHNIPLLQTIDEVGRVKAGIGLSDWEGQWFKDADKPLIDYLSRTGAVHAVGTITHTYPFCWRCDTPLLYYAVEAWFMDTPKIKKQLLANNQTINWKPGHIKAGRFGNWLKDVREWGISRTRFWGAPMPIWQCEAGHITVVESIKALKIAALDWPKSFDIHRPGIDAITIKCGECKLSAKRVEDVFDVWFESGCMPYGQIHYPFESRAEFKRQYPADFISEAIDQTRGWFYTLHVLAGALFNQPAAKTIVVSGWIVAADGQKLSKRLKNYPAVDEVFDTFGADSLRLFMLTSPVTAGEDVRFSSDGLKEVHRNVFMTLWNSYNFFQTYRGSWHPPANLAKPKASNILDRWMLARLDQTASEVSAAADKYEVARAVRPIIGLVDDLSNWYVRRSRRRLSKPEDAKDYQLALATLHYVLIRICQLLAPWAPFLSDKIYRELRGKSMPVSVHLTDWPKSSQPNISVLTQMVLAREVITEVLAERARVGTKVRQPLAKLSIRGIRLIADDELDWLIADETNVNEVEWQSSGKRSIKLDTKITHELKLEGLAREVIRHIQGYRKELGLSVGDKVKLGLETAAGELKEAVQAYDDLIKDETSAKEIDYVVRSAQAKPVDIEGHLLKIAIIKLLK